MVVRLKNPQEIAIRAARMEGVDPTELVKTLCYKVGKEVQRRRSTKVDPWTAHSGYVSLRETAERLRIPFYHVKALIDNGLVQSIHIAGRPHISRTVALTIERLLLSEKLDDVVKGRPVDLLSCKPKDVEKIDPEKIRELFRQYRLSRPAAFRRLGRPHPSRRTPRDRKKASVLPARALAQWGDAPE